MVSGNSQGGPRPWWPRVLIPRSPFASPMSRRCAISSPRCCIAPAPWPRWVDTKDGVASDPAALAASRYFDPAFFARRSQAESLVTVGLIDTVCPPITVYAAYNNLPGRKSIIVPPLEGHELTAEP